MQLDCLRFVLGGDGPDPAVKSFSPPWLPPPLRATPVRTPAPLLLRPFVFQYLRCRRIEIRDVYFSEGFQKVTRSVAFIFLCASHARWRCHFQLFQSLYGQSATFAHQIRIGTPMLGAVRIFCASHARWRCYFQFVQPLYCQSATFARGIDHMGPLAPTQNAAKHMLC